MKLDVTILLIGLGVFALFCCVAVLVERRRARVRHRARRIFGRIKTRPEASSPDDRERFNCRKTRWGMDKAAVQASEAHPVLREGENLLSFQGTAFGMPCLLHYRFVDGKLASLKCEINSEFENPATYLDTFNRLIKRLTRYYGVPSFRDVFWSENAAEQEFSGEAVAKGLATYVARWKTPYTLVLSTLSGTAGRIGMTVDCTSIAYLKTVESIWRP